MNKSGIFLRAPLGRFSIHSFRSFAMIFFIFVNFSLFSCVEKKMSLKEAKQVAVSMSEKSFVPPPRRVDDILNLLDQPGRLDREMIANLYTKADAVPPESENHETLSEFYFSRGFAARELGRYRQCLEDLRTSNRYKEDYRTLNILSTAEALCGNFQNAITHVKRAMELKKGAVQFFLLAFYYSSMGDFKACEKTVAEGLGFINSRYAKASGKWLDWLVIERNRLKATLYHANGQFAEAEPFRRGAIKGMRKYIKNLPLVYLHNKGRLDMNLAYQGRLIEAELEARETLKETIGLTGKMSGTTADILLNLGEILLMQGRLEDAEKLIRAGIRIFEASNIPNESTWFGEARSDLVKVLAAKQDFSEATNQIDRIRKDMQGNLYDYERLIARNPNVMLSLLKTGRVEEAMESIVGAYINFREYLGENHYRTAEILGLRAMAFALMKKEKEAMKDFSASVPILFKEKVDDSDYLRNIRLKIIIEAYLDLLTVIHISGQERSFGINASSEIFKMVESLNGSIVQSALGASGARAAAVEPDLVDLVRREQDVFKQINALKRTLTNALTAPPGQQNPDALKNLKATIDTLSNARDALLDEIQRRFPRYSDFTNPQPVSFSVAQNHLRSGETLIVIYPASERTYIWAIPDKGEVHFSVATLGEKELHKTVAHLRKSLAPAPETFGDIPDFDLAKAHELYRNLLKPVEEGWKDTKDLVIVAPGPLGQLPLSVLPTASVNVSHKENILFTKYSKVPWLIREVSITRVPSVLSFVTLRKLPAGNPMRRVFVGFGDPLFNREQLVQAESETGRQVKVPADCQGCIEVRGIRVTEKGDLDSKQISSIKLGNLNRLPDTAEEIRSIAQALKADPSEDIFLGKRASELQFITMDLSDRRVIAIASHALVAGDLDGLDQPALAFSAPSVTGENEDGLLTMGEILKLKLNADWVVLSACNTGAAEGAGAEAVSGLGRAFFYAGTRAILVSMWPVETTSARRLTTELFRSQHKDEQLTRAQALRKSMLKLIDGHGLKDNVTGQVVASYAHPLFWAPFILVGDNGIDVN